MHFLKSKLLRKGFYTVVVAATVALVAACGGTNNENGVSFTFFGFYGDVEGDTGVAGYIHSLAQVTSESPRITYLGLQNNLDGQFIRLRRVNYSYEIPGSTLPLPNSQAALGGIVGPTVSSTGNGTVGGATDTFDSSLPEGFAVNPVGNILYVGADYITPQFSQYLRENIGSLPETPFDLVATMYVTGLTSAGDVIETNAESINIQVLGNDSELFFVPSPSPSATTTEADLTDEEEQQLEDIF